MTRHRPDPATPVTAPLPVVPPSDGSRPDAGRPRRTPAPVAQPGWTSAMRTLDAGLVVGPRAYTSR